ncbi:hypothetical protein FACS1894182_13620 [Bacteroidia bacterium]|nr:hypothetical protein FACS1894182_13620 [Bacteroidia bacterium]
MKAMKRVHYQLVLPVFLLVCSFRVLSQTYIDTSFVLNTAQSGTKEYIAREKITLQPGFSYTPSSGSTFTARIDQTLVFPPTGNTYATEGGIITPNPYQGGAVGAIPGQFTVSPAGAAVYSIPIECPAGIQGMQPNLSIVYNSQAGNGYMGWGWNLSGISSISRCGNTLHFNDTIAEIKLNTSDNLMLDGQRLLLVSGSNFAIDAKYRTEAESYADITVKLDGHAYFEVKTKDGHTLEYGKTSDSFCKPNPQKGIVTWYISKVTDANGNYMIYEYNNDTGANGEVIISKIKYTGNDSIGTLPVNEIEFMPGERPDIQYVYVQNERIPVTRLFSAVNINIGAHAPKEKIKQYAINYNVDTINSKLASVTLLYPEWGSPKYNPTRILWDESNEFVEKTASSLQGLNSLSNIGLYYADFTGNGKTDIMTVNDTTKNTYQDTYKLMFYSANANANTYQLWHTKSIDIQKTDTFKAIIPGDFNGDGLCDFLFSYRGAKGGSYNYIHYLYLNAGNQNGFGDNPNVIYSDNKALAGDFDGDGRMELIFEKDRYIYSYTDGSSLFGQNDIIWGEKNYLSDFYNNLYFLDFNGDGKTDLMTINTDSCRIYTLTKENNNWKFKKIYAGDYPKLNTGIYFGDFNGDGKTDMLTQKVYAQINPLPADYNETAIHYSTGTGFYKQIIPWLKPYVTKLYVGDYNGDGRSDVCLFSSGNTVLGLSSGLKLLKESFSTNSYPLNLNDLVVSDFNGDGREDVLEKRSTDFILHAYGKNVENLSVKKIKDGLGQEININYAYLSNPDVYQLADTVTYQYPIAMYTSKLKVVSDYSQGGGSTLFNTSMKYTRAWIHKRGKGFLGFRKVESQDETSHIRSTTTYRFNTQYYFPALHQQLTELKTPSMSFPQKIATNEFQYSLEHLGTKRFFYFLSRQATTDHLSGLSTVTESAFPDEFGNLALISTQTGNNVEIKNIEYIQKGAWCKNKPSKITVTKEITGKPQQHVRTLNYLYDNKGNLLKQTVDSADAKAVVTEYKNFDAFGHPRTVEVSTGGQTRISTHAYTASGRFVQSQTNPLGETISYQWDEIYGRLLSETSRMGVTGYLYDALGRLTLTTYPDGIKTANTLQWAGTLSEKPTNAQYYSYSETSGQSPVWVWYDHLGREIRKDSYGLNRKKIMVDTEYNEKGQVSQVSEPHFENEVQSWAVSNQYDAFGRKSVVTTPMGSTDIEHFTLATLITSPEGIREITYNTAGQVIEDRQNDKAVTYSYYPSGLMKTATPEGSPALIMEYDLQGNRTELSDPDAGTITSRYDGWGQLVREAQRVHLAGDSIVTTYNYHPSGLVNYQLRNGEYTRYRYDNNNRLGSISIAGKHAQGFTYDGYDRIIQVNDTVDGSKVFVRRTEYDVLGNVYREIYPGDYSVTNQYDKYGYLTGVTDKNGSTIWSALESNARGQLTKTQSGNKITDYTFDDRGFPTAIVTPSITNWSYVFNDKCNLVSRKDGIANYKDSLGYDDMNRLTGWDIYQGNNPVQAHSMTYNDSTGNIQTMSDLGNYAMNYGGSGKPPHALTSITGIPGGLPTDSLGITYTNFKKVQTLTEGMKSYTLAYGVDEQRIKSVYRVNNVIQKTRYYMGNYEEETSNGNTRKIHYLSGGNGLAAIYVQSNGKDTLYYVHTDYQGSLTALSLANGTVKERYAYDPWGNRRNPADWTQGDTRTGFLFNRGYTLHEHLPEFKVINMNGRVYDPLTAMFFSPDPYVQAPGDWLNYNRYTYCLNNPFRYTDPSGDLFWIIPSIGYSRSGGWHFGLTVGVGVPGALSANVSVGYSTGNGGDFAVTVGASFGGFNVYEGYSTTAGGIAGAGFGFGGLSIGAFGISSNVFGVGINYSQNGGWSMNAAGFQYGRGGLSSDPSIGVNATARWGKSISADSDGFGVTTLDLASISTNQELYAYFRENGIDPSNYYALSVDIENHLPEDVAKRGFRRGAGMIFDEKGNVYGGLALNEYDGFKTKSSIYMSTHNSNRNFMISLNHEFIHTWQFNRFGYKAGEREWNAFKEASAYRYTQYYYPSVKVPTYFGPLLPFLYYWPNLPSVPK